jgi:hypothetical protein
MRGLVSNASSLVLDASEILRRRTRDDVDGPRRGGAPRPFGRAPRQAPAARRLPTFKGEGLQKGLSLDELGTIYDRMDGLR